MPRQDATRSGVIKKKYPVSVKRKDEPNKKKPGCKEGDKEDKPKRVYKKKRVRKPAKKNKPEWKESSKKETPKRFKQEDVKKPLKMDDLSAQKKPERQESNKKEAQKCEKKKEAEAQQSIIEERLSQLMHAGRTEMNRVMGDDGGFGLQEPTEIGITLPDRLPGSIQARLLRAQAASHKYANATITELYKVAADYGGTIRPLLAEDWVTKRQHSARLYGLLQKKLLTSTPRGQDHLACPPALEALVAYQKEEAKEHLDRVTKSDEALPNAYIQFQTPRALAGVHAGLWQPIQLDPMPPSQSSRPGAGRTARKRCSPMLLSEALPWVAATPSASVVDTQPQPASSHASHVPLPSPPLLRVSDRNVFEPFNQSQGIIDQTGWA
ncbi:unnamed protein product, partial [Mesorhabditis spiculigera]